MQYERLKASSSRIIVTALAVTCVAPAFGQDIGITPRAVFQGMTFDGITPVEVDLSNQGADTHGTLNVTYGDFTTSYPVSMRKGETTAVITYPNCSGSSGNIRFDLETDRGVVHQNMQASNVSARSQMIAEINHRAGDINFLATLTDQSNGMGAPQVAYLDPVDAPDRPIGYERLAALFIDADTTKLSDNAVKAIKTWAMEGGALIFVGNAAGASFEKDPRWADVMPVHNTHLVKLGRSDNPATIRAEQPSVPSKALEHRYNSVTPAFQARMGDPVPQASSRAGGLIVERPIGLGRAVYIAFNPLTSPMDTWEGRAKMFDEILDPSVLAGTNTVFDLGIDLADRYPGEFGATNASPQSVNDDPFQAKLPGAATVFFVLAAYFLAVVPINFLVLRKLKRGELAWATAPVISLAFAGVFFGTARGLYGAKLSTSTRGVLLAQAGQSDGLVIGSSQLFFPSAGRYDLHLNAVDSIDSSIGNGEDYYNGGSSIFEGLEPVDDGEIHAQISVPSLAFRQFIFRQKTQAGDWIDVQRSGAGLFRVTNNSPYLLTGARLVGSGGWVDAGDLAPNTSQLVPLAGATTSRDFTSNLAHMLVRTHGLAVTGTLVGFRPGPRIGAEVTDSEGISLVYMTDEHLGPSDMSAHPKEGAQG